jgi:cell division protein FtsW (lipid II flippase)
MSSSFQPVSRSATQMRIATADSPVRRRTLFGRPDPRQHRQARLESLALAVVTVVIATGFWITYSRQTSSFSQTQRELAEGLVVQAGKADVAALANRLTVFPSATERGFAAAAVNRWIAERGPLTHVGALASMTVPAQDVRTNRALTVLRSRLDQRPEGGAPVSGSAASAQQTVRLFTPADVTKLKPGVVVRTTGDYSRDAWRALGLFVLAFWFAHLARRVLGTTGDALLLPALQLLAGLSLIAMMSLRDPLRDTEAAGSVAIGVALACVALVCVSAIDFENPRFRFATGVPLAAAVALGVLLLAFGSGPGGSGVKVNLWGVQPIEAIRILSVLALAAYFSRRWETVRELSDRPAAAPYLRVPRWSDVSPLVVIVGTLLVFFFLQRDLGPALVLGCMSLALYGVARGRGRLVLAGLAVLMSGFAAGYALGFPSTVAKRVAIWLDPWENGLAGGDQVAHGLWALASGGIRGLGLSMGDGQLIPAGHTDLIVAVIGEEMGLVTVTVIAVVYLLLIWRILQVAVRAPGDYTAFLALGCALSLAVPAIVIAGGVFGAIPLSGVVTPFLSFGKSSMICNFVAIAIVLAIARRTGPVRPHLQRQVRTVGMVLTVVLCLFVVNAVRIEAWQADAVAVRPTLVEQGDGVARYQYNPRLIAAARQIPRGTIFDRNGLALATGDAAVAEPMAAKLRAAGVSTAPCPPAPARCYPLRGGAFHLLGDLNDQINWNAPNASFLERDQNAILQGFDDHVRTVERHVRGERQMVVLRDYSALLPLVRHKGNAGDRDVRRLLTRSRDVTSSVDGVFQALVLRVLEARVRAAGVQRGAVVVIDPDSGELLASASVPYPSLEPHRAAAAPPSPETLLDRGRYGLYPPGSTFKLVTAAAALRSHAASSEFMCHRLEDGRVGTRLRHFTHPVRDDVMDHEPHGTVDLRKGLVVSCNAYFAQLAVDVGAEAIADAAAATGIRVATDPVAEHLRGTLPYAGYGQGEVVATPMRMARVAGAIAADGVIRDGTVLLVDSPSRAKVSKGVRWLSPEQASFLATSMRNVVQQGTGRALAGHAVHIAGKTGTAEVSNAPSHSWFVGFAPYATRGRRIAFAVIVENAGYGGRVAAPLAGDVVSAAKATGVIK